MKRILHMIFESPNVGSALFRCLEVANPEQDSLLLLEDGVITVLAHAELCRSFTVFVLEHDVNTRGLLHRVPPEWSLLGEIEWVDTTLEHLKTLRWV
jgi:sulfur relay protein TusB/DsrH